MARPIRRSEAGFSLVTAVIIITLLVFLGTMVLSQVANDVQLAGGDRAAMNAMYIAEAGAVWAKDQLVYGVYPNGPSGAPQLTFITNLTKVTAVETRICPDGSDCSGWYQLDGFPNGRPYNNGNYLVAVTCNPNCSVTVPSSYSIRSYGFTPDGAQRLLELTVGY